MLTISYDGNPSDLVELGKSISNQIAPKEKTVTTEKTVTEVDKSESILLMFGVDLTGDEDARTAVIPLRAFLCWHHIFRTLKDLHWIVDWGDGNIEHIETVERGECNKETRCRISHTYAPGTDNAKYYPVKISYDTTSDEPMYEGWACFIGAINPFINLTHVLQVPYKSIALSETGEDYYYMGYFRNVDNGCKTLIYACDKYPPDTGKRTGNNLSILYVPKD
jgi:hypothetical protein